MSFNADVAIRVKGLSKCYQIYDRPHDRLKQSILPRLRGWLGQNPTNYFREFWALRNVSFDVARGETIGIIGRNGSGKSTLLQLICGTLEPTAGEVDTDGRVAALLELGAGFNPDFTGRENVYMNATVLGLDQKEIDSRFDDIAKFADIGAFIEQPVKHYSSGMYARLAFAVAINVDPRVLIVDEALAVGDEPFQRKCFAKIEEIKRGGGTILFVSHSSSAVVALCDRAVLLHDGNLVYSGKPKTAIGYYQKLMNAPENGEKILHEILSLETGAEEMRGHAGLQQTELVEDYQEVAKALVHEKSSGSIPLEESSFDPNLVSESKVVYESNGALILDPRIETLDGEVVNSLCCGQKYRVCYRAQFHRDCENVRFRCMLKTTTGVELGGGTFPVMNQSGSYAASGQSISLSFQFTCQLNPGVYFINCGLSNNSQSLHRIIDALIFRVAPRVESFSFGVVDFNFESMIQSFSDEK